MAVKLLAQGAEAKIYLLGEKIVKDRIRKNYRLAEIDQKLRKERTRREARILRRLLRAGMPVPDLLREDNMHMKLEISFIDGVKLRDYLDETGDCSVLKIIGSQAAKMHGENIVHGDLTTSNMIKKDNKVYFIDFGLSEFSQRTEDEAVDIHLFKECLISKHHRHWEKCWNIFLEGYKRFDEAKAREVLKRLDAVEKRGKHKQKQLKRAQK